MIHMYTCICSGLEMPCLSNYPYSTSMLFHGIYMCLWHPLFVFSLSLSFSLEIILRAETVEMVQAGDKCDFIGTLIAIPDVAQLAMESEC